MRPVHHIVNINTNDIEKANPFTFNVDDLNGVMDLTVETAYTLILLRDYFKDQLTKQSGIPFDKFGKNSNEETLEKIPMKDIENFLRKKKLKNINNKHE